MSPKCPLFLPQQPVFKHQSLQTYFSRPESVMKVKAAEQHGSVSDSLRRLFIFISRDLGTTRRQPFTSTKLVQEKRTPVTEMTTNHMDSSGLPSSVFQVGT